MKWGKVLKEAILTLLTVGRFFWRHPLVLCLLILLLMILYKYFFSWFIVLVTTAPIFLFTGSFLGISLVYGKSNNPENVDVYKKIHKIRSRNTHNDAKSHGVVSLPKFVPSDERIDRHNNNINKIRKKSHRRCSSSESGSGESDTDTLHMLHAFHHLNSSTSSIRSSQDGDSSASSTEDETENLDDNKDNELEQKEGAKFVAWTVDDQKNILKIGSLEIERNQRLEILIARRRARKYVDRNLANFGNSDSIPTVQELSKFNVQLPSVYAPRKNPFDLPYDEVNFPDSAPSTSLGMINAFNMHEQANESSSIEGANSSNMERIHDVTQPQRSITLTRHESFREGAPFLGQSLHSTQLRPYFIMENMDDEGILLPSLSEKSFVQDSDSTSEDDQESQKELLEDSSNQGLGPPFSQTDQHTPSAQNMREVPPPLNVEPPVLISDSSDDEVSLPDGYINDWEEAHNNEILISPHSLPLEDTSVMRYPQEIEMTHNNFYEISPRPDGLDSMESSTKATKACEFNNVELPGKEAEIIDGTPFPDPIYDSSPAGSEKPTPIYSAIDEIFLQGGNAQTSDAKACMEEVGSPSRIDVPYDEIAEASLPCMEESTEKKCDL